MMKFLPILILAILSILVFSATPIIMSDQQTDIKNVTGNFYINGTVRSYIYDRSGNLICNENFSILNGSGNGMFGWNGTLTGAGSHDCQLDYGRIYLRAYYVNNKLMQWHLDNGSNLDNASWMSNIGQIHWSNITDVPAFLLSEVNASIIQNELNGNLTLLNANNTALNNTKAVAGDCGAGNAWRAGNAGGAPTCISVAGGTGTLTNVGVGQGLSSSAGANITTTGTLSLDDSYLQKYNDTAGIVSVQTNLTNINIALNGTANDTIHNLSSANQRIDSINATMLGLNNSFNNSLNACFGNITLLNANNTAMNISINNLNGTANETIHNASIANQTFTNAINGLNGTANETIHNASISNTTFTNAIIGLNGTANETIHNASTVNNSLQTLTTRFNSANSSLNLTSIEQSTNTSIFNASFVKANNSLNLTSAELSTNMSIMNGTLNICIANQSWLNTSYIATNNTLTTLIQNVSWLNSSYITANNTLTTLIQNVSWLNTSYITTNNTLNTLIQNVSWLNSSYITSNNTLTTLIQNVSWLNTSYVSTNNTLNTAINNQTAMNISINNLNGTANETIHNASIANSTFTTAINGLNGTANETIHNASYFNNTILPSLNNATIVHKDASNVIQNATMNASNITYSTGATFIAKFDSAGKLTASTITSEDATALNVNGDINGSTLFTKKITNTYNNTQGINWSSDGSCMQIGRSDFYTVYCPNGTTLVI